MRRLLVIGAVAIAACATIYSQEGLIGEVRAQAGSDAIPPNYRELVARYVRKLRWSESVASTAKIATPYNKPDGLLGRLTNTTVPVICVSFDTRNMLGQDYKAYLLFSFDNGKPYEWPSASGVLANECGAFSPFTEVKKR